jgi:hypothetical protein
MRNRPVRRKINIAANGDGYAVVGLETADDHWFRMSGAPGIDRGDVGLERPAEAAAVEMADLSRHPEIVWAIRERGPNQMEAETVCSSNWLGVLDRVRG